jgi:hypothetical protein
MKRLLSIVESPLHADFSALYQSLDIREKRVTSMRKAISELKTFQPDFIVCEFFYGYGNNYAGVNVSNLDVMLASLPRYSPDSKTIVMVDKTEAQYVDKLSALFPLHAVLVQPVSASEIQHLLE